MTPLLLQFLSESRDFLEAIGERLMQLEGDPGNAAAMTDLFRSVHTLKGNSGLFDFPEMLRVLHASEDLMTSVRDGELAFSQSVADCLLDAMDFVAMMLDEIEAGKAHNSQHSSKSAALAQQLRALISSPPADGSTAVGSASATPTLSVELQVGPALPVHVLPDALQEAWRSPESSAPPLLWVTYTPEAECFFKGEDPFFLARQVPDVRWQRVTQRHPAPPLTELDPYQCVLQFDLVTSAPMAAIEEHFRYVPDQIHVTSSRCAGPADVPEGLDSTLRAMLTAQLGVLGASDSTRWEPGRVQAVTTTIMGCLRSAGQDTLLPALEQAAASALAQCSTAPLAAWLAQHLTPSDAVLATRPDASAKDNTSAARGDSPGRRLEDQPASKTTLKVDQDKIDRLMNLIGEIVVAKNGLPFLAGRAESVFGSRDLSREIKAQYAVINRIAEEMQDAIMQVRMLPVSTVTQRFPRLVRDISRKLGKEVNLALEGTETEADKNVVEALADPLIHIVRNSLDHGIELPDVRVAAGKGAAGQLVIRASQDSGRVLIDVHDDGKGIDPLIVKRKALAKGIIDQAAFDRISDQDAVNLVFAAGFSTVEQVSDLSGRGVGMDVVRTAVEKINGTVTLHSEVGRGTRLRLSLPLSMAVTNVMIVESNRQIFGVPMDVVLETVRVPQTQVHSIKNRKTTVLRDRIMPLRSLNELLAANEPQVTNDADELAALVVQIQGEQVGIVVDDFREVVDIILKPMGGILGGLPGYAGSALLGDGSVLMVLNPKELVSWA